MAMIIIDTPSKNDAVILAALRAADMIICPVMVDLFSLAALQDTARVIDLAGKLPASVAVLNDLDETGVEHRRGRGGLEGRRDAGGAGPDLPIGPAYTAAIAKGLSVTELGAKQKAAADEIRELSTFLDAGAPQPKQPKTKAKKPGKKGAKP
jgi:cellulose biosynthesis protein BcsQ